MLKLYKTNFTHDELLAMAAHARNFCPFGYYVGNPCTDGCELYRVCRDFHNLADYCKQKVDNREYSDC